MGLSSRTSAGVTESSRIAAARLSVRLSVCPSVWQMSVGNRGENPRGGERQGEIGGILLHLRKLRPTVLFSDHRLSHVINSKNTPEVLKNIDFYSSG